jgi:hypothetical protein
MVLDPLRRRHDPPVTRLLYRVFALTRRSLSSSTKQPIRESTDDWFDQYPDLGFASDFAMPRVRIVATRCVVLSPAAGLLKVPLAEAAA